MTNWHHSNPIMTAETAVSLEEFAAAKTLNGTDDIRRFDVRIDSLGQIFARHVPGKEHGDLQSSRDGVIIQSDEPMRPGWEIGHGKASDYCRNHFGCIVQRDIN